MVDLHQDSYWGGYTERGVLLHFVTKHEHGPRSACGCLLTGGAWHMRPGDGSDVEDFALCAKCDVAAKESRDAS